MVALFARAWIEMVKSYDQVKEITVALFARAWIEIATYSLYNVSVSVALFARAWIEMLSPYSGTTRALCRPLCEGVD